MRALVEVTCLQYTQSAACVCDSVIVSKLLVLLWLHVQQQIPHVCSVTRRLSIAQWCLLQALVENGTLRSQKEQPAHLLLSLSALIEVWRGRH